MYVQGTVYLTVRWNFVRSGGDGYIRRFIVMPPLPTIGGEREALCFRVVCPAVRLLTSISRVTISHYSMDGLRIGINIQRVCAHR